MSVPIPPGNPNVAAFQTTHWSMVLQARQGPDTQSREALEALCLTYWYPLYVFVRRHGHGPEDAGDLTQDFFAHLLQSNALTQVDPSKGRFRSFLLASMKNLLANNWKQTHAQKRGGHSIVFSLDEREAEERYRLEPFDAASPDKIFEQRWAEAVIQHTLDALHLEWSSRHPHVPFGEVKAFLVDARGTAPLNEAASRLGLSLAALKSAVHRLRHRYREIFRQTVAHTVASPLEVEEEMRHLLAALAD